MEFSRQEYWSGLQFPTPRDLPGPGIEPMSPTLAGGSFPLEPPGKPISSVQFIRSVTPWTAARQTSLSITNSRSLLKLTSIESVMPSKHLILCCPLLLLPSIFPSIRVFSNESGGQSIGASVSSLVMPMNIQDWFPLELTSWISLHKAHSLP